ncbi:MAG: hydroxymethylbilane synthase [Candidatus Melainabacteria bacterium]|nr:hydroxymethylbilane synthase [Candidatus Melainabacteria bacterium]
MTVKSKLIIGTRSSKLACWQANYVKDKLLRFYPELEINLKEIKTKGDHITDVALSKVGGKGFFTKEIEDALLKKEIDLAVHSLKDLPTKLPSGLKIGAVLKRESPHDVLITRGLTPLRGLPPWAKIGTSSLRRIAQLKALRPDLEYIDLRGNLDTRIRKLEEGKHDGIVLAYSGVKRLGFENKITEHFNPKEILPAIGQGALAIEIREERVVEELISKLNDQETYLSSIVERAFLETLQGGCQVPIGAYSEIANNKITLYGMIASLDGKKIVKDHRLETIDYRLELREQNIEGCYRLGKELAERLLQLGGKEILQEIVRV